MSYNITQSNGEQFYGEAGLPENTTDAIVFNNEDDKNGGLIMIGKLTPEYGVDQSNNFLRLLEHFASRYVPNEPVVGMLYYKKDEQSLYICTNKYTNTWTKLLSIKIGSETPESAVNGDLWYNDEENKLFIYDESIKKEEDRYVLIGPSNYQHKEEPSYVTETYNAAGHSSSQTEININNGTVNMVTARIVASEKSNVFTENVECASWICRGIVESKKLANETYQLNIIGNPNYELVSKTTDKALSWDVSMDIINNKLIVTTLGTTEQNENTISWEIDVEIIKV